MATTPFFINDLDALDDDAFDDVIEFGRGVIAHASPEQREAMVVAHEAWVATLDADMREDIDWSTETRSNWDLYAELRMNGVDFERVAQLAPVV